MVGDVRLQLDELRTESLIFCPKFIYKTLEKVHMICSRVKTTYSRQISYADHRRRDFEFQEGDKVYLQNFPRTEW